MRTLFPYTTLFRSLVTGNVITDYMPVPLKLAVRAAYRYRRPVYTVTIRAREGAEPFTVASVEGHKSFFEVESKGSAEAANEQRVRFRLRADAPVSDRRAHDFRVRITLSNRQEVTWPVRIVVLPAVRAQPAVLDFGIVAPGDPKRLKTRIVAADGRAVKVTGVRSLRDKVLVQQPKAGKGIIPTLAPLVRPGLPIGSHTDIIVVELDDKDIPEIRIKVSIEIREKN